MPNKKVKKLMEYLNFIRRVRWCSPRGSKNANCAIIELDLELRPDAINWLCLAMIALKLWDPRVNTDHPVFRYMSEQAKQSENAEITLTMSIRQQVNL